MPAWSEAVGRDWAGLDGPALQQHRWDMEGGWGGRGRGALRDLGACTHPRPRGIPLSVAQSSRHPSRWVMRFPQPRALHRPDAAPSRRIAKFRPAQLPGHPKPTLRPHGLGISVQARPLCASLRSTCGRRGGERGTVSGPRRPRCGPFPSFSSRADAPRPHSPCGLPRGHPGCAQQDAASSARSWRPGSIEAHLGKSRQSAPPRSRGPALSVPPAKGRAGASLASPEGLGQPRASWFASGRSPPPPPAGL